MTLLVGATIWAFLGIIFEFMTETVAWERWEGTIEYTFMAPLSRLVHLFGQGAYAVLYGLIRATILFFAVALFLGLHAPNANYGAAFALLALASISFIGVGIMTSVLPLISPEKGAQLGFVAQGLMLVVSGVYYPVSVMPEWMQWIAKISPATYALRGCRASIVDGAGIAVGERLAAADHRGARDADRPGDLQGRRAVREEAREAEAVGMTSSFVRVRRDADLEAWRRVRIAVAPLRADGLGRGAARASTRERLMLLAYRDGQLAGSGLARPTGTPRAASRSARPARARGGRGVGTALLDALARARSSSAVSPRPRWTRRRRELARLRDGAFGFEESTARSSRCAPRRSRRPGAAVRPKASTFTRRRASRSCSRGSIDARVEAFEDIRRSPQGRDHARAMGARVATLPEATFVALADGEIVGCAGLLRDVDRPERVRARAHGRPPRLPRPRHRADAQGDARSPGRPTHGLREIYTWTQTRQRDACGRQPSASATSASVSITLRRGCRC